MDINTPVSTNYGDWREKYGEIWARQVEDLRTKFGDLIEEVRMPGTHPTDVPQIFVKKESIVVVLAFVQSAPGFEYKFLADITATDEETDLRFEVVYNLYAMGSGPRIRFKARCRDGEDVPSVVSLWPAANWVEREVYDMFGVKFSGHPDLRRILMDERWVGHPLRKDYPLKGYQIFPEPMRAHPELLE